MGFSRQEYWCGLLSPSPGDLPNPGIEPRAPALQVDSLPSEPPGKSKNTRVGSLSLLQGNFLTQKLNQDLLHCRWILYQLSYQGSPEYFALLPLEDLNPSLPHDRQGYPPLYKQVIMLHIISPGLFFIIRSLYLSINFTHFAPTPMPVSGNFQSINCIYGGLFLTYLKNILKLTGDEYTYLQIFCVLNHSVMFDSL